MSTHPRTPGLYIRSAIFNVFFFLWMLFASFIGCMLGIMGLRKALSRWSAVWGYGFRFPEHFIAGLDYDMKGWENLPPPPAIIAMQHQSAWETYHMFHWFPNASIVFKKSLLKVPFLGTSLLVYGGIPVARSKKAEDLKQFLTSAKKVIADKRNIVIFPQGTRTKPGEPAEYNKGAAVLYGSLNIPIVPVTLDSGNYWGRNAFFKYPGRIQVQIHPPIMPGMDREAVMEKLKELYEKAT